MRWIFMQTTQRIFNFTNILVLYPFLDKIWKLLTSHTFLPITVEKLSTVKKQSVFWHTLYVCDRWLHLTCTKTLHYFMKFQADILSASFPSRTGFQRIEHGRPLVCWSKWHWIYFTLSVATHQYGYKLLSSLQCAGFCKTAFIKTRSRT